MRGRCCRLLGRCWRCSLRGPPSGSWARPVRRSDAGVSYARASVRCSSRTAAPATARARPRAAPRVDTYLLPVARLPDGTYRARAGTTNSPRCPGRTGGSLPGGHMALPKAELTELQAWVVDCANKPKPYTVHINGWMRSRQHDQFHGRVLRQSGLRPLRLSGVSRRGAEPAGRRASPAPSCHISAGRWPATRATGAPRTRHRHPDLNYNSATSLITVGRARVARQGYGGMHAAFPCQSLPSHPVPTQPATRAATSQAASPPRTGAGHGRRGFGARSPGIDRRPLHQQLLPRAVPRHEGCGDQPGVDQGRAGPGRLRQLPRESSGGTRAGYPVPDLPPALVHRRPAAVPAPRERPRSTWRRRPGPAWAATGAATTRHLPSICSGGRDRASRPSARTASASRRCTRSAPRWPAASATSCRANSTAPVTSTINPRRRSSRPMPGAGPAADGAPVPTTRQPRPVPPTVTGRERGWRRTPPRASTGRRPSTEGRARPRAAAATDSATDSGPVVPHGQDPRRLPHLPPEHRRCRRQHHRGRRRRLHAPERSNRVTPGRSLPRSLPGARGGYCRRGRRSLRPPSHRRKGWPGHDGGTAVVSPASRRHSRCNGRFSILGPPSAVGREGHMESNLQALEEKVTRLTERVDQLEQRLSGMPLPSPPQTWPLGEPDLRAPAARAEMSRWVTFLGRTVWCSAEPSSSARSPMAGCFPPLPAWRWGSGFAAIWLFLAHRATLAGAKVSAGFHAVVAAVIAYPLVLEATTRLGAMSATAAALTLAGFTGLLLFLAWRDQLAWLAWVGLAACGLVSVVLLRATDARAQLIGVLLVLAVAAFFWLGERWPAVRWLPAVLLDLVLLRGVFTTTPLPAVFFLALAALSLAFVLARTASARPLGAFEISQGVAGLAIAVGEASVLRGTQPPGRVPWPAGWSLHRWWRSLSPAGWYPAAETAVSTSFLLRSVPRAPLRRGGAGDQGRCPGRALVGLRHRGRAGRPPEPPADTLVPRRAARARRRGQRGVHLREGEHGRRDRGRADCPGLRRHGAPPEAGTSVGSGRGGAADTPGGAPAPGRHRHRRAGRARLPGAGAQSGTTRGRPDDSRRWRSPSRSR